MKTVRQFVVGFALGTVVVCTTACNAITGLNRNYVEVDCFPLAVCPEGGADASGADVSVDASVATT
jgi:hypothetical protein